MHKYRILQKKGEGTFSEVLRAQNIATQQYVAIKVLKTLYKSHQVNTLNEIIALKKLKDTNCVVKLLDIIYDSKTGKLALVFELMDCNLYELIEKRSTTLPLLKLKYIMYDVLYALSVIHTNQIFHRDIKPENILISKLDTLNTNTHSDTIYSDITKYHNFTLKLADFGSSRKIIPNTQPYTEYISTRWYRAPECLLTNGFYDQYMDLWGIGCVFYEILTNQPLFAGSNELDQIDKICKVFGDLPNTLVTKFKNTSYCKNIQYCAKSRYGSGIGLAAVAPKNTDPTALQLIEQLLQYTPSERISAKNALKHTFFDEIRHTYKPTSVPDLSALHTDDSTTVHNTKQTDNKLPDLKYTNKTVKRQPLSDKSNLLHSTHSNSMKKLHTTAVPPKMWHTKSVLPTLQYQHKLYKSHIK